MEGWEEHSMKQVLQRLYGAAEREQDEISDTERIEQFAQSVLERYRTDFHRIAPLNLLHLMHLPLQTQNQEPAAASVSNWDIRQARETESISKLLRQMREMEAGNGLLHKKMRQESARIEKLEKQARDSADMERRVLRKIHSHTEREIRSVRDETIVHTTHFQRNIQRLELESRKQVQETIREGFLKEVRILRRIEEEKPEVLLVYPDITGYIRQSRWVMEEASDRDGAALARRAPEKKPAMVARPGPVQYRMEKEPQEQAIRRIVKEQVQDQARWLSERLYRHLERRLFDEKKRRGF